MPAQHNAPQRIETIARGLLIADGRILLCRNVKDAYRYLPGGHVEPGELGATALAREFHEESGVAVEVGPLLLVSEHGFLQNGKPRHEINLTYEVRPPAAAPGGPGAPDLLEPGGWPSLESKIAFDWVKLSDLASADLRPVSIAAWVLGRAKVGNAGDPGSGGPAGGGCGWFGEGLA